MGPQESAHTDDAVFEILTCELQSVSFHLMSTRGRFCRSILSHTVGPSRT